MLFPDEKSRAFLKFVLAFWFIYSANAIFGTFFPVYLNHTGYSNTVVGIVLAIGPIVAIVAQPVWGVLCDRVRVKNSILLILLIGSAVTNLLFPVSTNFWYIVLIVSLFSFFQTSIMPISDAITLEHLGAGSGNYGRIRLFGTLGYAVMSILAGIVAKRWITGIFPLYFVVSIPIVLTALALPKVNGHQTGRKIVSPFLMLKDHKFLLLMILNMLVQSTLGYYNSFYSIFFRQLGGDNGLLGWAMMLCALSEVPFLLFSNRILKKFGVETILVGSTLIMSLRWLLVFLSSNKYLLLLTQLFHGCNYVVFTLSLAVYINETAPKELRASSQALSGIVTFGLSKIVGSVLGGYLSSLFGIRQIFFVNFLITAVSAVFFGFVFLRGRGRPAQGAGA